MAGLLEDNALEFTLLVHLDGSSLTSAVSVSATRAKLFCFSHFDTSCNADSGGRLASSS